MPNDITRLAADLAADGWSLVRTEELERLRKAAPEPGAVTEWAVRYKGRYSDAAGGVHIQPYDDEDMARRAAHEVALAYPPEEPRAMYRHVGPWKEAPNG